MKEHIISEAWNWFEPGFVHIIVEEITLHTFSLTDTPKYLRW